MSEDRFEFRDVILALLENALAEAHAGNCQVIDIELGDDAVRVSDDGQGLPVGPHPQSKRPLTEVILTGPRRGPRNTLAKVNAACLWVELEVEREGVRWYQRFELAKPATLLMRRAMTKGHGTRITCAPALGEPPSFEQLRDYVLALEGDELAQEVRVRIRDLREARDETIVLGAV